MFLFRFFLSCCSRAANWGEVKNFSEVRTVFQISPTPSIKLLSRGDLIQFPFLLVSRSCSSCTHAQQLKFKPRVTWAIALSSLTFCFPALAFLFFVFSLIFDMFSGYWRAFFERGSCARWRSACVKISRKRSQPHTNRPLYFSLLNFTPRYFQIFSELSHR